MRILQCRNKCDQVELSSSRLLVCGGGEFNSEFELQTRDRRGRGKCSEVCRLNVEADPGFHQSAPDLQRTMSKGTCIPATPLPPTVHPLVDDVNTLLIIRADSLQ